MSPQFAALALGVTLIAAEPCVIVHQFEPGPIVNGHHRQPTPGEIETRMQELRARSNTEAGPCMVTPHGNEASVLRARPDTGPARS
jgi:hypothetical protein